MNLIPANGIVLRKVYCVRPAAICLLFSLVPYQVILSVFFAPHRQIYLIVCLGILHCNLHGSKVRGHLRRYRRHFLRGQLRNIHRCMRNQFLIAVLSAIYMNLIPANGIVFREVYCVRPAAVRLLFSLVPCQVILSVFFAPHWQIYLLICLGILHCDLHGCKVGGYLRRYRRHFPRGQLRNIHCCTGN